MLIAVFVAIFSAVMPSKSWHFEASLKQAVNPPDSFTLLPARGEDFQKVVSFYQHHPVPGYDIGSVQIIYNPSQNMIFSRKLPLLQSRHNNSSFAPKWSQDYNPALRAQVNKQWQALAVPHTDRDYPAVKLLPLWHGTRPEILNSIFESGYANLAITDGGFFGKGIYSTHEAEYAVRVYSKGGALLLNWVAMYSAYPVIDGDMPILAGKGNYSNYDAHFVPVRPQNPDDPYEIVYLPCASRQPPTYTEVVVFDPGQCLPRYIVELQPTLPKAIGSAPPQLQVPPAAGQQALLLQTVNAKQPALPVGISIPAVAKGYEEFYRRFFNGKLIYKPDPNSDNGRIELPIAALQNPLAGTFDLSRCGDTGQYLQIATGYRQQKNPANANKLEIWLAPRFLIEKTNNTFKNVMGNWQAVFPLGIFWTFGAWDNLDWYDYLTYRPIDDIVMKNLLENWEAAYHGRGRSHAERLNAGTSQGICPSRFKFLF